MVPPGRGAGLGGAPMCPRRRGGVVRRERRREHRCLCCGGTSGRRGRPPRTCAHVGCLLSLPYACSRVAISELDFCTRQQWKKETKARSSRAPPPSPQPGMGAKPRLALLALLLAAGCCAAAAGTVDDGAHGLELLGESPAASSAPAWRRLACAHQAARCAPGPAQRPRAATTPTPARAAHARAPQQARGRAPGARCCRPCRPPRRAPSPPRLRRRQTC